MASVAGCPAQASTRSSAAPAPYSEAGRRMRPSEYRKFSDGPGAQRGVPNELCADELPDPARIELLKPQLSEPGAAPAEPEH